MKQREVPVVLLLTRAAEAVRHETTHPAHAHQCWRELFGAEYKS